MNKTIFSVLPPLLGWLLLAPGAGVAKDASPNLELARQLNQAFVEVAEKVSPTVVVINVVQRVTPSGPEEEGDDGAYDSLPPGFWRKFHEEFRRQAPGLGSGIVLREDGYILTNTHVVENADKIEVRLQDGRTFKATLRGSDPKSDVAVIKVNAKGLPVATLADSSKTRVGEFAIAIGAPFSLDYSVTFGHVSAKGRSNVIQGDEGAAMDQDFIQTDALINPGNSGGPLVNINGEVIGINTLIRGMHTGIGFAVPSSLAKEVADKLIADGRFIRPWLGIGIRAVREDPDFAQAIKGIDDGVIVSSILADGPAARSSLKAGDVITAVDGQPVNTPQQLRTEIRTKKIGQPVTLDVFRGGKTIQIKVSPSEWVEPAPAIVRVKSTPAPGTNSLNIGVTVQNFTSELAEKFGVDLTEGVVVTSVEKNSAAARKNLKPGDVITSINQQPVRTPKQFHDALKAADLKAGLLVNLISGNTARFEILKTEP
jgi:serine protease Do